MTQLLYKLVNLTIFYDVRDDVELIWFTNLQEASLHIYARNFVCQIEPIIYSILGRKKTEPKLGFDGKKTERLKGPKIQVPWKPYYIGRSEVMRQTLGRSTGRPRQNKLSN